MKPDRVEARTRQLEAWTGQFGNEYVERNAYADWKMAPGTEAFRRVLGRIEVGSVLEIGSNVGLNLIFINEVLNGAAKLYALEPNKTAFNRLTHQPGLTLEHAWNCDVFNIPAADSSIDLTFTAGVLIHIAPDDLGRATDEIVRVARRYVLCAEYFSHSPVEVPYRGEDGLLFKRDFGGFYLDRHPNLKCADYGFLWQREFRIFDNLNWWLLEKTH